MRNMEFLASVRRDLRVTARLVDWPAHGIRAGERFTMRFTGLNAAPGDDAHARPTALFVRPELFVRATPWACPEDGPGWYALPAPMLGPGESCFLDLPMRSASGLPNRLDPDRAEDTASAWIRAEIDRSSAPPASSSGRPVLMGHLDG